MQHEKMLRIISGQRNGNQNYSQVQCPLTRMTQIKKADNTKSWQGCGVDGTLRHCCGGIKWYNHFGKMLGIFFKTLILFLGIYPREVQAHFHKVLVQECLQQLYPYYSKTWIKSKSHNRGCINKLPYSCSGVLSEEKEQNTDICHNMDEYIKHYV